MLKIKNACIVIILTLVSCLSTQLFANQTYSLTKILPSIMPTVVNIASQGRSSWSRHPIKPGLKQNSGKKYFQHLASGVIINAQKGYVITNAHAVHEASTIIVTLNNGKHEMANILGIDAITDLALLQIKPSHLKAIKFGKERVTVGQEIIAIGNPFGLAQTVTSGIVSGLHRHIGIEGLENFIQIDAPINPGNSGGALINTKGELVGINTAIIAPAGGNVGIGFAIPLSIVKPIIKQLITHHNIKRGLLGVMAQNLSPSIADAMDLKIKKGAIITEVIPKSTADKIGIKPYDVIVRINHYPIVDAIEIKSQVGVTRLGDRFSIGLLRNGKLLRFSGKLLGPPKDDPSNQPLQYLLTTGMTLSSVDVMSNKNTRIRGIIVDSIERGTRPWLSGLMVDDIITKVNKHAVKTLDEFKEVMAKQTLNKPILINVLRNDQNFLIALD